MLKAYKMMMTNWMLTAGLCLFMIHGSYELKCYVCKGCNDVFNSSEAAIANCDGHCAKTKREHLGYVVRFCTPGSPDPDCVSTNSANWGYLDGCVCNTDLCNSATLTVYSAIALSAGVLSALVFYIS